MIRMTRRYALVLLGVLGLAGLLAVWLGLPRGETGPVAGERKLAVPENQAGKAGDLQLSQEAMELAEVRVRPVLVKSVQDTVGVTGEVQTGGNQIAKVSPRAAGKVIRLLALEGDQVVRGQTLAVLESAELALAQADYRQAVSRLQALDNNLQRQRQLARLGQFGRPQFEQSRSQSVESRQTLHEARHRLKEELARLAQSQAERDVQLANLERARELKELVAQQEVQRIEADYKKAEADIGAAQARIEGARGDVSLAESRLSISQSALQREQKVYSGHFNTSRELVEAESTVNLARVQVESGAERVRLLGGQPGGGNEVLLTSPIGGRVQQCAVTLGETVPAERVAYTVVDLGRVWANLALSPKELRRIKVGDAVELRSDGAGNRVLKGRISHVSTASDEITRAVYVKAVLANPEGVLKAGNFVSGSIIVDERHQKLAVPLTALQEHMGRPTVYVQVDKAPGNFEVRHVLLGSRGEGWREVTDGLKPGESVATGGTFYLKSEALKSSLSDGCCGGD